jgi:hypothetical protein
MSNEPQNKIQQMEKSKKYNYLNLKKFLINSLIHYKKVYLHTKNNNNNNNSSLLSNSTINNNNNYAIKRKILIMNDDNDGNQATAPKSKFNIKKMKKRKNIINKVESKLIGKAIHCLFQLKREEKQHKYHHKNRKNNNNVINEMMMNSNQIPVVKPVRIVKKWNESCKRKRDIKDDDDNDDDDDEQDSDEADSNKISLKPKTNNNTNRLGSKKQKLDDIFNQFLLAELTEQQLWLIATNYSDLANWKLIASGLGVNQRDLSLIEADYLQAAGSGGVCECLYQSLLRWRLQQPENCSMAYFTQILTFKVGLHSDDEIHRLLDLLTTDERVKQLKNKQNEQCLQFYVKSLNVNNNDLLKMKLNEKHLWKASAFLFQEWKSIGRHLNLTELDLISIESKHLKDDGLRECCYQSLLHWSQISILPPNLEQLSLNLINMRFNLYARQLIAEFATATTCSFSI